MNKLTDLEPMTMKELGDVYYSEKGQNRLTKLPEKFYERAAAYLKRLQVKVECSKSEDASIYGGEAYQSSEEIHRAREIVERIYNTRERKIVLAAMNSARGIKQDLKDLDSEEDNLYYDSKLVFGENRDSILRFDRLNPKPDRMRPETGINTTTDDFVDPMDIREDRLEKAASDISKKLKEGPKKLKASDSDETDVSSNPRESVGSDSDESVDSSNPRESVRSDHNETVVSSDPQGGDLEEGVHSGEAKGGSRHHTEMAEGSVVVRALKDIDDFTALDGSVICLRKEDIIYLDGKMAMVLIEGDFVELVEG